MYTKFSGELPPEIVSLIREFSRPILRYPREYHEAMRELGLTDWHELKVKLSGPEAEQVLVYVQDLLAAERIERQEKNAYKNGGSEHVWSEALNLSIRMYFKLWRCCNKDSN